MKEALVKGTRIVIKALSENGCECLAIQKKDEIALRDKYKDVLRWRIPLNIRSYLKTVSLFIPANGSPSRHEILGFKKMTDVHKSQFYLGVKQSFKENGCGVDDFEVSFYDE